MALKALAIEMENVIYGTRFDFEQVGDELPVHTHTEENNHGTFMVLGEVECFGRPEIDGVILRPDGMIIDWKPNKPHGFRCTVAPAIMIQLSKKR